MMAYQSFPDSEDIVPIHKEVFDFDIESDGDDEVFFGDVGFKEKCVTYELSKECNVKPLPELTSEQWMEMEREAYKVVARIREIQKGYSGSVGRVPVIGTSSPTASSKLKRKLQSQNQNSGMKPSPLVDITNRSDNRLNKSLNILNRSNNKFNANYLESPVMRVGDVIYDQLGPVKPMCLNFDDIEPSPKKLRCFNAFMSPSKDLPLLINETCEDLFMNSPTIGDLTPSDIMPHEANLEHSVKTSRHKSQRLNQGRSVHKNTTPAVKQLCTSDSLKKKIFGTPADEGKDSRKSILNLSFTLDKDESFLMSLGNSELLKTPNVKGLKAQGATDDGSLASGNKPEMIGEEPIYQDIRLMKREKDLENKKNLAVEGTECVLNRSFNTDNNKSSLDQCSTLDADDLTLKKPNLSSVDDGSISYLTDHSFVQSTPNHSAFIRGRETVLDELYTLQDMKIPTLVEKTAESFTVEEKTPALKESFTVKKKAPLNESFTVDKKIPPLNESFTVKKKTPPLNESFTVDKKAPLNESFTVDTKTKPFNESFTIDTKKPLNESFTGKSNRKPLNESFTVDTKTAPLNESFTIESKKPLNESFTIESKKPLNKSFTIESKKPLNESFTVESGRAQLNESFTVGGDELISNEPRLKGRKLYLRNSSLQAEDLKVTMKGNLLNKTLIKNTVMKEDSSVANNHNLQDISLSKTSSNSLKKPVKTVPTTISRKRPLESTRKSLANCEAGAKGRKDLKSLEHNASSKLTHSVSSKISHNLSYVVKKPDLAFNKSLDIPKDEHGMVKFEGTSNTTVKTTKSSLLVPRSKVLKKTPNVSTSVKGADAESSCSSIKRKCLMSTPTMTRNMTSRIPPSNCKEAVKPQHAAPVKSQHAAPVKLQSPLVPLSGAKPAAPHHVFQRGPIKAIHKPVMKTSSNLPAKAPASSNLPAKAPATRSKLPMPFKSRIPQMK